MSVLGRVSPELSDLTEARMAPSKILNLMAFVPAKDFELSRRFYRDLGFHENWGDSQACEFELEGFRFLLQNFYVKDHAGNFMMSLLVEDADKWWEYIQSIALAKKYDLYMAKPPTLQPWGLRVLYLTDPTGVLWHIADRPKP
jgi:catechol 2,3-dioxygenase-like lactoylglutathione lyase family enzyme